MEIRPTTIDGLFEICLDTHADARGSFSRQFCERAFAEAGLETHFVQVNHSVTLGRGSVRGMHYQLPPVEEVKLVSCTVGRVFDVAVDMRPASPSYRRWAGLELDGTNAFYIPKGCAHGFQTLTDEARMLYLMSDFYTPQAEAAVRHDDPAVGIDWPLPVANLSDRDRGIPFLTQADGVTGR